MQERDDGYAIRVGLLAVIAFMSWPVWLAIVSGQRSFTTGVALSALVPLALDDHAASRRVPRGRAGFTAAWSRSSTGSTSTASSTATCTRTGSSVAAGRRCRPCGPGCIAARCNNGVRPQCCSIRASRGQQTLGSDPKAVRRGVAYAGSRRARWARIFSRLPQIAMLHHRAEWFFDRS